MLFEIVLGWLAIGLIAYIFAMFGMDRVYGEYQQDLLTLEKKIKNPRNCPICKQNLTTWFSQCVNCFECDLRTCRPCADFNVATGEWTCRKCVHRRTHRGSSIGGSLQYWYDFILSGNRTSLVERTVPFNKHVDRATVARYEQLENFVARNLNITIDILNSTDVGRIFKSDLYDNLFSRYHDALSREVSELLHYLKSEHEVKEAISLRKLKELMAKIKVASKMELGVLELNSGRGEGFPSCGQSFSPTYPDVLSTAILNRIIIDGQTKSPKSSISPISHDSALVTDYCSTSTDLPESGSEKGNTDTHTWVMSSTADSHPSGVRTSDEESTIEPINVNDEGMRSVNSNWSSQISVKPQLRIEESIEEITTTTYESDESSDEGGDSSSVDEENKTPLSPRGVIQKSVANWEHNWLFKRRRDVIRKRQQLLEQPVTMLVPNPSEDFEVMIGQQRTSDLEDDLDSLDIAQMDLAFSNAREEVIPALSSLAPVNPVLSGITVTEMSSVAVNITASPVKIEVLTPPPALLITTADNSQTILQPVVLPSSGSAQNVSEIKPKMETFITELNEISPSLPPQDPEETLYETNHSVTSNETIAVKPEEDCVLNTDSYEVTERPQMKIAEREIDKWNHPVTVKYNPYAPENLNRRLQESEIRILSGVKTQEEVTVEHGMNDDFPLEQKNMDRFRRDYYVNQPTLGDGSNRKSASSTSSSSSTDGDFYKIKAREIAEVQTFRLEHEIAREVAVQRILVPPQKQVPGLATLESEIEDIKLPSVRNLAKKFSSPHSPTDPTTPERDSKLSPWKLHSSPSISSGNGSTVKQQLHSSVVRSATWSSGKFDNNADLQTEETFPSARANDLLIDFELGSPTTSTGNLTPHSPPMSLYSEFSKPIEPSKSTAELENISWNSTRRVIDNLERKSRETSELEESSRPPVSIRRVKSMGGKSVLPPLPRQQVPNKEEQDIKISFVVEDPELEKLKRSIVLGSRTGKGVDEMDQDELHPQE